MIWRMFLGATSFNQNIGGWDVSNVTKMVNMFKGAHEFDDFWMDIQQFPRNGGNVLGAIKFNQSLNSWNVSGVTT